MDSKEIITSEKPISLNELAAIIHRQLNELNELIKTQLPNSNATHFEILKFEVEFIFFKKQSKKHGYLGSMKPSFSDYLIKNDNIFSVKIFASTASTSIEFSKKEKKIKLFEKYKSFEFILDEYQNTAIENLQNIEIQ